jgi:capsid protein
VNLPLVKIEKFRAREFWGRTRPWVDPEKAAKAQVLQHRLGRTLESIQRENGWPENEVEPRTYDQVVAEPAFAETPTPPPDSTA